MRAVEHIAPAYWASYLINGDASGLDDSEQAQADAWIDKIAIGAPVDVSQEIDLVPFAGLLTDCAIYTFLVQE